MGLVPKKTKADYHIFRHISVVKVVGFIFTIAGASELGDFFVAAKLKYRSLYSAVSSFSF